MSVVLQVYVSAPLTVNVVVAPVQMLGLLTVNIGNGLTVTLITAVFEQLFIFSVPVTVYVAVAVGLNAVLSGTPLVHVYVSAPPPIRVVASPAQITVLLALAVTFGKGLTVTLTAAALAL